MAQEKTLTSSKCLLRLLLVPESPAQRPSQRKSESVCTENPVYVPVPRDDVEEKRTVEDKGFLLRQMLLSDTCTKNNHRSVLGFCDDQEHSLPGGNTSSSAQSAYVRQKRSGSDNASIELKTESPESTSRTALAKVATHPADVITISDVDDDKPEQADPVCIGQSDDVTDQHLEPELIGQLSHEGRVSKRSTETEEFGTFVRKLHPDLPQPTRLKKYNRTYGGRVPYVCRQCAARFSHLGSFKRHMHSHTNEKPFICKECGAGFIQGSDLKTHMRTHTGDRPHVCELCNAAFTRSGNLKRHMQTHTGEKPFECEKCGAAFTTAGNLKTHMVTHTGDRPYMCKQCGSTYTTYSHLKVHIRSHTGERPYVCKECRATFVTSTDLKNHMRTHTGDRPFVCKQCGSAFTRSCHLKRHLGICLPVRFESPDTT